jgi:hypothetical protein
VVDIFASTGKSSNPSNLLVVPDASSNNHLYFSASNPQFGNELWVSDLVETALAVPEQGKPREFALSQNYPNPFNPSTTIRFELPRALRVNLDVYNTLGQEVAKLLDEERPAGAYEVSFNAKGLASGVYFYRIRAGEFVATKKLLLVK